MEIVKVELRFINNINFRQYNFCIFKVAHFFYSANSFAFSFLKESTLVAVVGVKAMKISLYF
jgi:hypothetical protein